MRSTRPVEVPGTGFLMDMSSHHSKHRRSLPVLLCRSWIARPYSPPNEGWNPLRTLVRHDYLRSAVGTGCGTVACYLDCLVRFESPVRQEAPLYQLILMLDYTLLDARTFSQWRTCFPVCLTLAGRVSISELLVLLLVCLRG
ncbi:hypothetical protein CONLIGDRAFT_178788 [Coniochaeta ligniaria NRRL 30616]|uniref:Uncharacterized protein n=1 Tax=Coniochaeta ligniaria NRRL 30616 TaxID=1408157 RepID=A0A1J7J109_9PEZI|nr:hypothetical protein CONLIGDRAFT_178788 [Coniochaeta ligniaria NRRL 30616]